MNNKRKQFYGLVKDTFGQIDEISREQISIICDANLDLKWPAWLTNNKEYRADTRASYKLIEWNIFQEEISGSVEKEVESVEPVVSTSTEVKDVDRLETFVPKSFPGYVPFGYFDDVKTIIESEMFFPTYITGLSGNGKTLMILEASARAKREIIRANITSETDEDDLIGSFRLIKGETVWQDGPVITAMKRGATLLLDEVDLASNRIMCLQPVLEGRPIFLKKIGKVVSPEKGFNVIATANTKGKGSLDGRFIGTMVMNEAFLERFAITMEQEYPDKKHEIEILKKEFSKYNVTDDDFVEKMVEWASTTRILFSEGAVTELISTRRLVHLCQTYSVFKNRKKAISFCLNRFDEETKKQFLDYYSKIDASIDKKRKDEEESKRVKEANKKRKEQGFSDPSVTTASTTTASTTAASGSQFPW